MADRTVLTPITAPTKYQQTGVGITWTAADATNKNRFKWTGNEVLLVKNTNSAQQVITVQSENDTYGREGDQVLTLAAGDVTPTYGVCGPFPFAGWVDSGGYINVDCASAEVFLAVVTLNS